MIVYVDVLIVTNFIVNYLLILVSGRLCGTRLSRWRIVLAALVGALSALAIFLPALPGWCNVALKLLLTLLIAAIAGGYSNGRGFIKRVAMLLAASFVFAGLMLFVTLLSGGKAGFYANGACYFHISAVELLAFSSAAYAVLLVYQKLFKRGMAGEQEYSVEVAAQGHVLRLTGVMDSQNNLLDFFSGTPVVVGPRVLLEDILPPGVRAAMDSSLADAASMRGVRLIPCGTVSGQDILPAFRPDRMTLRGGGTEIEVEDVYIAVSARMSGAAAHRLILNPALTGRKKQILSKGGVFKSDGESNG